jgi:cell wall assembly regulator SMI1
MMDTRPGTAADVPRLQRALAGFEARIVAQDALAARLLRPGLADDQIDALTAHLPFAVPVEIRTWFGWHDGVNTPPDGHARLPCGELYPVSMALSERESLLAQPIPDALREFRNFRPTWLPIRGGGGPYIVVESDVRPEDVSPVRTVDFWTEYVWEDVRAPSIANMVELWNQLIDDGYWRYSPTLGDWEDRFAEMPPELRHSQLV